MSYKTSISEQDARKKWCPFARIVAGSFTQQGQVSVGNGQAAHNRIDAGPDRIHTPDATACIASSCMAWRWVETHLPDEKGDFNKLSGDTHGYCGLAGPEWRRAP